MRKSVAVLFLGLFLSLAGCQDRAVDMYETAQFEEQQFNKQNAEKLYRQILEDHPESPYAAKARQRLEALGETEKR